MLYVLMERKVFGVDKGNGTLSSYAHPIAWFDDLNAAEVYMDVKRPPMFDDNGVLCVWYIEVVKKGELNE